MCTASNKRGLQNLEMYILITNFHTLLEKSCENLLVN